jgi:peroxiredoxin
MTKQVVIGDHLNSMPSKYIYSLCILLLAVANVWNIKAVRRLDSEKELQPPGVDLSSMSQLRNLALQDGSRPMANAGSNNHTVLVYLFSPIDCPVAVEELEELEKLHREQPAIDIRAIALFENAREALQTRQKFQLDYPVISDPTGRFSGFLKPPATPWKLFFEPVQSQLLLEDGPSVTMEEKVSFHRRASAIEQNWQRSQEKHQ